jgi:hypothetical protein
MPKRTVPVRLNRRKCSHVVYSQVQVLSQPQPNNRKEWINLACSVGRFILELSRSEYVRQLVCNLWNTIESGIENWV